MNLTYRVVWPVGGPASSPNIVKTIIQIIKSRSSSITSTLQSSPHLMTNSHMWPKSDRSPSFLHLGIPVEKCVKSAKRLHLADIFALVLNEWKQNVLERRWRLWSLRRKTWEIGTNFGGTLRTSSAANFVMNTLCTISNRYLSQNKLPPPSPNKSKNTWQGHENHK